MATKYIDFEGTISWANSKYGGLFEVDPKFDNYKANFYLNPKSWSLYKDSGLRLKTYNDEMGDYVQFKRRKDQIIGGKPEYMGPPKVFFEEGIEPTKDIGNGSSFRATVSVFDTRNGKGHRLERVIITDLIKFEASGGGGFDESKYGKLQDSSAPVAKDIPFDVDEPDDEIPFGGEPEVEPNATKAKKPSPFRR